MYQFSNIKQLQADLKVGKTTCVKLVEQSFSEIEKRKNLNIFLEVFKDSAMQINYVKEKENLSIIPKTIDDFLSHIESASVLYSTE